MKSIRRRSAGIQTGATNSGLSVTQVSPTGCRILARRMNLSVNTVRKMDVLCVNTDCILKRDSIEATYLYFVGNNAILFSLPMQVVAGCFFLKSGLSVGVRIFARRLFVFPLLVPPESRGEETNPAHLPCCSVRPGKNCLHWPAAWRRLEVAGQGRSRLIFPRAGK